jgi:hypothetical protein
MELVAAAACLSDNRIKREKSISDCEDNCKLNIGHVLGTRFTYKVENLHHPTWHSLGKDIYAM